MDHYSDILGYPDDEEDVELTLDVIEIRELSAIHVSDGDKKTWLPLSKINIMCQTQKTITVLIPEWLALEKGLI